MSPDYPLPVPGEPIADETVSALVEFYQRLAASQRELSPDEAKALRENAWDLYD